MLGRVVGLGRLGAHGLGGERGPVLARVPEPPGQLVAEPLGIVDRQRDEGRRHVAVHTLEHDADLLLLMATQKRRKVANTRYGG